MQNILPVVFNIKKVNYFIASLIGLTPTFFIMNTIGSGLNLYIKQAEKFNFTNLLFTKEIYIPIIIFIIILLMSVFIKNKIFITEK